MPQTAESYAFLVASQLDIKGIKTFPDIKPLAVSSSGLFCLWETISTKITSILESCIFRLFGKRNVWAISTVATFEKDPPSAPLRDDYELGYARDSL